MRKIIFIFILGFIGSLLRGLMLDINLSPYILVIGINAIASFLLAIVISSESKWIVNLSERIKAGLMIGLIGGLGSLSRYGITLLNEKIPLHKTIPVTTLIINVIGAFCLGLVLNLQLFPAITSGFFSGFTTFSTFIMEIIKPNVSLPMKIIYIGLTISLGICGFILDNLL